jgi:hypothetical protein
MKHRTSMLLVAILSALTVAAGLRAAPPTTGDVGDADSFGNNAQYMGAASSGFIVLSPNCSAEPSPTPVPDNQCFTLVAAPGTTTFDAQDIARIRLPKKATKDIIYPIITMTHNYQFLNTTGVQQPQALFTYTPYLTIESDALNNPSVIDPSTGAPAAGRLQNIVVVPNTLRDDRTLEINERIRNRVTFSRSGIGGFNKTFFVNYGIPSSVVDDMFKSAITVRLNVRGSAKFVSDGFLQMHMRLFGD